MKLYPSQMIFGLNGKRSSHRGVCKIQGCAGRDATKNSAAKGMIASVLALSLLNVGTAWGAAAVESRSESSNWRSARAAEQQANLELVKKLEFLQQEVQELRGRVEEQAYQMQQMQERQKKLYLDLDNRLREGTGTKPGNSGVSYSEEAEQPAPVAKDPGLEQAPSSPEPLSAAPTTSTVTSQVEDEAKVEEKAYQNAYHLIQGRDYEGGLVAFQKFVKDFPRGKYLPNAYYWLGEIYLTKGNVDLAANAFNTVYRNYPQHPKAADSLLKLGYVEYAKGHWKQSQELLNQVKSQFPGSTSAQLADARLQKIQHEGH